MNNEKVLSAAEKAWELFQAEAKKRGTNYFGDLVQENLRTLTSKGYSPKEAVEELYKQAEGYHGRRC